MTNIVFDIAHHGRERNVLKDNIIFTTWKVELIYFIVVNPIFSRHSITIGFVTTVVMMSSCGIDDLALSRG